MELSCLFVLVLEAKPYHVAKLRWKCVCHNRDHSHVARGHHGQGKVVVAAYYHKARGTVLNHLHDLLYVAAGFLDAENQADASQV